MNLKIEKNGSINQASFNEVMLHLECINTQRVLNYLNTAYPVGHESLDKKEYFIKEKLIKMNSSNDFLEAVKAGDIEMCAKILE